MLDLWSAEYRARWSARTLAGLVVAQCSLKPRRSVGVSGIARMFKEIRRRTLGWRLLGSMPGAVWDKIRYRMGIGSGADAGHYIAPVNSEAAIKHANMTLGING